MRNLVFITGASRSGTSMTAGVVFLCGAYGGVLSPPKKHRRLSFENPLINQYVVNYFLTKVNADIRGQNPLPDSNDVSKLVKPKNAKYMRDFVKAALRQGSPPYFVKSTRISHLWPVYTYAYPYAKWVIVRRDTKSLIDSCMQTAYMDGYTKRSQWMRWVNMHNHWFQEIKKVADVFEIWPQKIIDGDLSEIRTCITEFLQLPWKEPDVIRFITPALYSQYKRTQNG